MAADGPTVLPSEKSDSSPTDRAVAHGRPPRGEDASRASERPSAVVPRGRRRVRLGLFLLLPIALIVASYFYVTGGSVMSTDDAYVQASEVGISTDVSGIVKDVDVKENQHVVVGQVLYRLDDLPFRLALDQANAEIGMVRNDLDSLEANYSDMQTQISQAQTDVQYYETQYKRQQNLLNARVASQSSVDTARRNLLNARQKLASLHHQLAAVAAKLSGDPQMPVARQPRYLAAVARRDEAARQLAHATVRAPFAGIVTHVSALATGKYLPAAATAFYLVATGDVWVEAQPKETELTDVKPGQPVTVTVDSYPGVEWHGTVASISPATPQVFSLLPAENSSGNWVKVVQRIPMRVHVDTSDKSLPSLRDGMSAEVNVKTGHERGLPHFLMALFGASDRSSS